MLKLSQISLLRCLLIGAVLLLLFFLPFRIPYTIKTIGKVQPCREWQVIQASDGQISTHLLNHQSGVAEKVTVTQMLRGDAVKFQFHPKVFNSAFVAARDTIAVLHSPDLAQAIAALRGDLAAARASLMVIATGEKPSLLEEARQEVNHALLQAEEQRRVADRLAELHARQLVSIQEYELALATQRAFEANIGMAKARLLSLQTGAKEEQIQLIQSQINSLEEEIAVLQEKAADYVLCSPISGTRIQHFASDTLLSIAEQGAYIITMPVNARERALLPAEGVVRIHSADGMTAAVGRIIFVNPMLQLLNGEQVFWAIARTQSSSGLMPGLFVKCEIECAPLRKSQFLQRFLQ